MPSDGAAGTEELLNQFMSVQQALVWQKCVPWHPTESNPPPLPMGGSGCSENWCGHGVISVDVASRIGKVCPNRSSMYVSPLAVVLEQSSNGPPSNKGARPENLPSSMPIHASAALCLIWGRPKNKLETTSVWKGRSKGVRKPCKKPLSNNKLVINNKSSFLNRSE